jgi:hypothetical protein
VLQKRAWPNSITRENIPNYIITELLLILQFLLSWYNAFTELYKTFLERHTINSNSRFTTDLLKDRYGEPERGGVNGSR